MGQTRCEYNWQGSGRQVFYDSSTYETFTGMYPCQFYDDFLGADIVIPAVTSEESGCKWSKKLVTTAGSPAVAGVASTQNGLIQISIDATQDEAETAALYMSDQLTFSVAQGAILEAKVKLSVLPGTAVTASWGFWGAYAASSNYRVGFEAVASGAVTCESDDNATDTSASSGVTVTTSDWKIYRIDCTTQSDIKFFIDGVGVATTTTFANAASAANAKMQPYFGVYKAAGAVGGTMQVDYVKIMQNRS